MEIYFVVCICLCVQIQQGSNNSMKKVLIISIMYITLDRNFNTFKLPGFRKFLFRFNFVKVQISPVISTIKNSNNRYFVISSQKISDKSIIFFHHPYIFIENFHIRRKIRPSLDRTRAEREREKEKHSTVSRSRTSIETRTGGWGEKRGKEKKNEREKGREKEACSSLPRSLNTVEICATNRPRSSKFSILGINLDPADRFFA